MDRQIWRLLVICTAYSIGAMLVWATGAGGPSGLVPLIFGVAAYVFTRDADVGPRGGGGNVRYWRGRRIDGGRDRWS